MPRSLTTKLAAFATATSLLAFAAPATARAEVDVVASFKPIHSLVAAVMKGAGEPHLLINAGSPHTYSLKPSDAEALQKAQVVVWVGEELEPFLEEPLATLAGKARIVTLAKAEGLNLLPFREGGDWEAHDHGGAKHADEHAHEHEHEETDLHLWLDPMNAAAMVKAIAAELSAADPANAALYAANAAAMDKQIAQLTQEIEAQVAPFRNTPYIVFHDAYQYFENRFDLNGIGSVTVSPDKQPGARHLVELKDKITRLNVACVFAEPQFPPKMVATLIEGSGAKAGTLDPVGADIAAGPDLYPTLLRKNADAFIACVKQ